MFIILYMEKIKEVKEYLKKNNIDFCFIVNSNKKDSNFLYFTNFDVDFAYLLIPKKGKTEIIVSEMEYSRAKKYSKIKNIKKFSRSKEIRAYIKKKLNNKRIGINYENVTLGDARRLRKYCKIKDISKFLLKTRSVKTYDEIRNIKKACLTASKIMTKCIDNFYKFKTEKDVENFLIEETQKNDYDLAFKPVVASGYNAAMPHYRAKQVKLKKGFCVIDFGVAYKNYNSDITRTVYIGNPSNKEVELYNKVLSIQEACIKNILPGIKAKKIDSYARKNLSGFIHGLGHGIGVEIHEFPNITEESKDILKKKMVFTIEPGTYKEKKYGIRIEDTVLLKDKPEILTKTYKKLKVINLNS